MLRNNNLHIVRIGYKTKTEVKQAVSYKQRYFYHLIYLYHMYKCWFSSYPMFSHLQQRKQQTNTAMMIPPAITEMVMMRVWKFTEIQTTQNACDQIILVQHTACSQTQKMHVKFNRPGHIWQECDGDGVIVWRRAEMAFGLVLCRVPCQCRALAWSFIVINRKACSASGVVFC